MNEVDRNRKWGIKDHDEIVFTPVDYEVEVNLADEFTDKFCNGLFKFIVGALALYGFAETLLWIAASFM